MLISLATCVYSQTAKVSAASEPGVTENTVVIGSVLPATTGQLASIHLPVKSLLTAFFDEVNSKGGINGRRVVLKFAETASTAADTRANFERFIREENVFALSTSNIAGAENEIAELMRDTKTPLVGPLTLYPQISSSLNRHVFYLLSGVDTQARALVDFLASKPDLKTKKTAIIYSSNPWDVQTVAAIRGQLKKDGLDEPLVLVYEHGKFDASQIVKKLTVNKCELLFFYGSGDDGFTLSKEAEKNDWYPTFFQAGVIRTSMELSPKFHQKVFLSFPTSPADQTAEGIAEFRSFSQKYKLSTERMATQVNTYASAIILVEGLRRAGRELTRERLVQSLESLSNYSTGLTPPITYGPNRRTGSSGAYVISIDLEQKKFVPVSGWLEIN